ncbi:MAG: hypothetical protein IJ553_06170 [Alloprevotella sp.]|nr:hypothetical protein [Alloprevotella sp.]
MKYRQAKKIIKRRYDGGLTYQDSQMNKAIIVFVHHQKKTHLRYYERRGIIEQLRNFYEKKK